MKKPRVIVENFDTKIYSGEIMYVDIDVLRFAKDKNVTNIVVQILNGEDFVYLDEFEPSYKTTITKEKLAIMAQQWIIRNVKIKEV